MYANREHFFKQEGFKLTVTPFILHAVVKALQDFPGVNSSLEGENIIEWKNVNLGIAVATAKGLIVPVVKNAEEKSFTGLARSVQQLVKKARDNKLTYEEIEGSTFSITNYGIFGNVIGLPIINQPNVAILGIGAIKKRPVVLEHADGDAIAIRSMTFISMSYDHRLVDGELGGKFMQRVVEYLEDFNEEIL
jgi:2-oxoglutarate dehydrogenase E2 component (dihydrolipoamide succinyltransferase)